MTDRVHESYLLGIAGLRGKSEQCNDAGTGESKVKRNSVRADSNVAASAAT